MNWTHLAILLAIAFVVNLPLGKWRSFQRRLSPKWFLAIHASIPALIALRVFLQIPLETIPISIGVAVLGQYIGGNHL